MALRLLKQKLPHLIACISTNGLLLADTALSLKELGVATVSVTVNAVNPAIAARIYRSVTIGHKNLSGDEKHLSLHITFLLPDMHLIPTKTCTRKDMRHNLRNLTIFRLMISKMHPKYHNPTWLKKIKSSGAGSLTCYALMDAEMTFDASVKYLIVLVAVITLVTLHHHLQPHKGRLNVVISLTLFLGATFGYLTFSERDRTLNIGSKVPTVRLKNLVETDVDTSKFKNRNLVIYFWNDRCGCTTQLVQLRNFVSSRNGTRLAFVTVNEGQQRAIAQRFIRENELPYEVLLDSKMTVGRTDFGIKMLPTIFIVDEKGMLREKIIGLVETRKLEAIIDSYL